MPLKINIGGPPPLPLPTVPDFSTPSYTHSSGDISSHTSSLKTKSKASVQVASFSGSVDLPATADALSSRARRYRDHSALKLKGDHNNRPMWVCTDGMIFLELFLPVSKQASDFLVTIAEPICRPELIHEFQITVFSLYGAISVGLSDDELLDNLNKFSKNELPEDLVRTIRLNAQAFGKVKLVLRDNKYWVEATDKKELDFLLSNEIIRTSRVRTSKPTLNIFSNNDETKQSSANTQSSSRVHTLDNQNEYVTTTIPVLDASQLGFTTSDKEESSIHIETSQVPSNQTTTTKATETTTSSPPSTTTTTSSPSTTTATPLNTEVNTQTPMQQVYAFEVLQEQIEEVKREALERMLRPLVMEYDFRKDKRNPNLNSTIKCTTKIRYYQERALRKMFSNGRARSGIIVLPCGAGKTLTGITAACTIRKSVMVLTTSAVAVEQWKRQFEEFTSIQPDLVKQLTSDYKSDLWDVCEAGVLVSTYTMMAFSGKRSVAAERILQQIRGREWGLLIFDEVQYAPAPAFRKVNETIRSHCKLGLTATLVREDDLIKDLQWLIGPKLYEANWLELQERGFLARVTCQEVWCPMTPEFFKEYIRCTHAKQRKLWVCNPNKMMICEFLIKYHEARGDKIIVFSDNVFALLHAAKALQRPFIYGKVSPAERMALLTKFKNETQFNTIFLSKVGDNAIDIPCANVVIQISFNFASRRQEAQRLGRILRPKPKSEDNEFNSFFYTLVSKDTHEMVYADKRQQFIIDQGYSYRVIHSSSLPLHEVDLIYRQRAVQNELLNEILVSNDNELDEDEDDSNLTHTQQQPNSSDVKVVQLKRGLASISGGNTGQQYYESKQPYLNKGQSHTHTHTHEPMSKKEKKAHIANMHPLFRKFHTQKM